MGGAQLVMLGDLVDFDLGLDTDLAPHADDRLDHLVVLRLEAAGRLDLNLTGFSGRIAAGGEQLLGVFRIVGDLDRRIVGAIFRRFERVESGLP